MTTLKHPKTYDIFEFFLDCVESFFTPSDKPKKLHETCQTGTFSSRMCERGTKGCTVQHEKTKT